MKTHTGCPDIKIRDSVLIVNGSASWKGLIGRVIKYHELDDCYSVIVKGVVLTMMREDFQFHERDGR